MKNFFIYLFVIIIVSCSGQKQNNNVNKFNDWNTEILTSHKLYGKIKSMQWKEWKVTDKFGEIDKTKEVRDYSAEFNEFGYRIEYDYNYKFNNRGYLLEKHAKDSNLTRSFFINKEIYEYNEKDLLIKVASYINDTIKSNSIYKYDINNNILENNITFNNSKEHHRVIYKNNRPVEELHYIDETSTYKFIYKYNNDKLIEELYYTTEGNLFIKTKYDDNEQPIEYIHYSDNEKSTYKNEYDKNGNIIKRYTYINGELKYLSEWKYNYFE